MNNNKNKNKKKKNRQNKKESSFISVAFRKLFLFLFILIILLAGFLYFKTYQNGGGLKGAFCTILGLNINEIENLEPLDVLVLGVSEDINSELTDTIILCHYDPQKQSISILSIPRDTFVGTNKETAVGADKINALYSKGSNKTLNAVNKITSLKIENYIVIKTSTLIDIVNIIGKVEFDVPIDMNYDDPTQDLHIHLSKGLQKLNGDQVEQLLRFRHNNDGTSYPSSYGDNDFGRMKTQRDFLKALADQIISPKNFFKIFIIYDKIFKNLDTTLTKEDLLPYIPWLSEFNASNIKSNQLPGTSERCNGLWFFIHDKTKTDSLIKKHFNK